MMSSVLNRFLPTSGRRVGRNLFALAGLFLTLGCNYGFQGGGGFPASVRTIFIEPFENQTTQFELQDRIYQELLQELPDAFGVRPAGREVADAIVRGRIVRYDDVAQNVRAGSNERAPQVLEHQVQITVAVEIIDVQRNVIIWESSGVTGRGSYLLASQSDVDGWADAIDELRQAIVDGARSQW